MSLGINRAWIALIDSKTNKIITGIDGINGRTDDKSGIFQADVKSAWGLVGFNLTNMAGSQTDIYGSNRVVYISQGKAAPQGVLTANAFPHMVLNRMLGRKDKGNGGFEAAGQSNTYVALLVESAETFDIEEPLYVGFYKAIGQDPSQNMQTNNASEQRQTNDVTFKAAERGDDGFGAWYYVDMPAYSKEHMFEDFFPGADVSKFTTTGEDISPAPQG
ncbi:major tail protein [Weissella viridescens]|uniref:Major tail protein n=2 Tax=Weissella TaxID=46255 RepID=A0A0R2H3J8_WEIVI|nr:major tail protein [Weissella viridescens]KRN46214.1 major tail protein [Weissella viridescens]